MLQNANNYAQQSVILQQLLPRLRTDVSHEGQDLEDLLFDFNVDIGRHEHSEQWFDVVCDCRRQILVSFVNESPQQLDRSLDFFHFVLKYRVVDLIQNLLAVPPYFHQPIHNIHYVFGALRIKADVEHGHK